MLEVRDLRASYGGAPALAGIALDIAPGDLAVIVGPNGAGKTTLINALAGLHRIDAGSVRMDGRDLVQLARHRFCEAGIALVPEGRRLFGRLSVKENLQLGSYHARARRLRRQSLERVCKLFPILGERLHLPAASLSGGQQQMLAIGRALMAQPRLLLLDEPSLGLAPAIVLEVFRIIRDINASGVAVLLVEQNVAAALDLARRAYVLEEGRITAAGAPGELAAQTHIQRAYLGH
jgi:branched-chain amino acid transport system ATP-binding protein